MIRFRTLAIAATLFAGLAQPSEAFAPRRGAEAPVVAAGRAPRAHRDVVWTAPTKTALAALPGWHAQWDRDTDVPLRLWGPSIATPGASADPAVAEKAARNFLASHLALLAPGSAASDFVIAANVVSPSGEVRTVTFLQHANGLAVLGGAVGFSFENDHLMMVSSTALPNVAVRMPVGALPAAAIANAATSWLAQTNHSVVVRHRGDRVIVPVVRPRGHGATPDIEYRVAETISLDSTREANRWDVWIDAADASPIARRTTLAFASGIVQFNAPDRYPLSTRGGKAAPFATHTVNGTATTAAMDGTITWATGDATVLPGLSGTYAAITNVAGALVTGSLALVDGGTVIWDESADGPSDAQLDAYVYENTVKHFVLTVLNPELTWAKGQISVNVNEDMTCNAYSTGDDIHFFIADPTMCENTGRVSDVVYHETGHSVHFNSIIPGEGAFDSALSEGLADTMAVSITGDHGMGRGFFFNDMPLRDVGAPGVVKIWPQDADGEPHDEGEIIGETLWDLRVALQAKLGMDAGTAQELKIYYGIMQTAADIPSTYAAALVTDDDDGNLANGTPNECEINAAFGKHGLADPSATIGLQPPTRDDFTVSFTVMPPMVTGCTPLGVTSAVLDWNPHGATGGEVALTANSNTWSAVIPTQPDGTVVEYSVTIALSDGSTTTYPQNPADPKYQFYVGAVTPIQCFDFESGITGWTHGATPSANDQWGAGVPPGIDGDPKTAHGGANVLGMDLGGDNGGQYFPNTKQWAQSPAIDLAGNTAVRLQYWRWLNVEDGAYDQATILANNLSMWTNFASPGMPTNEINHTDKEWRFQDVDLSAQTTTGTIQIKFELDSDPGLQLGGWTIDDMCLVTTAAAAAPTCGNGVVDPGEQCDDGAQNGATGDPCTATCTMTAAGKDGGGCCSASSTPAGPLALSMLTIGLVLRRRRRVAIS